MRSSSLNHVYRVVWSQVQCAWVAVAENAPGRGKSKSGKASNARTLRNRARASLTALAGLVCTPLALASPSGGQVVSGAGSITQAGSTTSIRQGSQNLAIDWQSFNIAAGETVNFLQPSASSIALNRVLGNNGSQILGSLNANGQVYLINPNGVLFGAGVQVNVGGLVATTLNVGDAALGSSAQSFSGTSAASVINQGHIRAAPGGYVALVGATVGNNGSITAPLGTVALAAGSTVNLGFSGNSLVHVQVAQSTLKTLAANGGLVQADGGRVLITAGARDALLASAVNNSGIIEARTVQSHNGSITLLGGMAAGSVNVGGTLDASAPAGGNGGAIETSAAQVSIAAGTVVTTAAPLGLTGSWLIDPTDFTVAATGGDMTGATLSASLAHSNVTIASGGTTSNSVANPGGAGGTAGDVNINDTVSWKANTLTLLAFNNININRAMNGSLTAGLALQYGQGAVNLGNTSAYNINAPVNLASTGSFSTQLGTDGAVVNYTIVTSLGAAGSTTATDLQGMNGNLSGNYVLGANIDASTTSAWNGGAGFTPVGNFNSRFAGVLDGLGHTVSNLVINQPGMWYLGLFGFTTVGSLVENIGMVGGSVTGLDSVGDLVGTNFGTVRNSYASGTVSGLATSARPANSIGGLVGANYTLIQNCHATGTVNGQGYAGGLVGYNNASIIDSYASGNVVVAVNAGGGSGGLAGVNYGSVTNSYASGMVQSSSIRSGGLIGVNYGLVTNSHATGPVSGTSYVGGLVGDNIFGSVANSYATGDVNSSGVNGGGLVGANYGPISNSYATGAVVGASAVGGLAGTNTNATGGTIATSYSTGAVTGTSGVGGLVGVNTNAVAGAISNSYWNTTTSGQSTSAGGTGLTSTQMQSAANFAGFTFTTSPGASGNAWVMMDIDGSLNNTGGAAGAVLPMLASEYATTISNAHQLELIAMAPGASYVLAGTIDASATGTGVASGVGTDVWGAAGFIPVPTFSGTFDGRGNSVDNLTINLPSESAAAPFDQVTAAGVIENVGFAGGSITGRGTVGGLVAVNAGTISNSFSTANVVGNGLEVGGLVAVNQGTISGSHSTGSVQALGNGGGLAGGLAGINAGRISKSYATGAVSGASYSGGLCGANAGSISVSYASGSVTGTVSLGGLVGYNYGSITNAYATGAVSGSTNLGGLVAINSTAGAFRLNASGPGTIATSYSSGAVTGTSALGGLVAVNRNTAAGAISNSYWNTSSSGQASSAGGTGLTGAQMMQAGSYAGWSISSAGGSTAVWRIYEGHTDPLLLAFLTPFNLPGAGTVVKTFSGAVQSGSAIAAPNPFILGGPASGLAAGFYSNGYYSTQQGYDLLGGDNLHITPLVEAGAYPEGPGGTTQVVAAPITTGIDPIVLSAIDQAGTADNHERAYRGLVGATMPAMRIIDGGVRMPQSPRAGGQP